MSVISMPRFEDWEAKKLADEAFAAAAAELEPGYQVARLRIETALDAKIEVRLIAEHKAEYRADSNPPENKP